MLVFIITILAFLFVITAWMYAINALFPKKQKQPPVIVSIEDLQQHRPHLLKEIQDDARKQERDRIIEFIKIPNVGNDQKISLLKTGENLDNETLGICKKIAVQELKTNISKN